MMRDYFTQCGVPFDFVLFTNYEQQVRSFVDGDIDLAWNGPIAHVLSQQHLGEGKVHSLGMRDVDRDFESVIAVRKSSGISNVDQLSGTHAITGASDSPQAHLIPVHWLVKKRGVTFASIKPFDLDMGKHGDTGMGEVKMLESMAANATESVGILSRSMWERGIDGAIPSVDPVALRANFEVLEGKDNLPPVFDQ